VELSGMDLRYIRGNFGAKSIEDMFARRAKSRISMPQVRLILERKFSPLFWTQFFGAFNDNFLKNALVILVEFQSVAVMGLPPSQIVALAGGIFILPFFLFSALAGQVADKYEKGLVIRAIKAIEILIMSFAVAGFLGHHFIFLLIVLFLMGLHSTFFGPLKYSILPQHLNNDELLVGTALIEAGTFIAILLGTIAGGFLIALTDGVTWVCVGLLVIALIGFGASQFIPRAAPVDARLKIRWIPFKPTAELFHFAKERRDVYGAIWGISWFWFLGASMLSIFPPLCKDVFLGNEHLVTLFLALFSIGIAVGSICSGYFSKHKISLPMVVGGGIGMSVTAAILFFLAHQFAPTTPSTAMQFISQPVGFLTFVDLFLFSVAGGFYIVPLYTLMQRASEPAKRSRVIAANNVLNALLMVGAAVFLIVLMQLKVSIPFEVLILAILNLIVTLWFRRSSRDWKKLGHF
jgi:MFS family permease